MEMNDLEELSLQAFFTGGKQPKKPLLAENCDQFTWLLLTC